jgi:thiol peroxidase
VAQVSFLGNPLTLAGEPPRAGERARDFTLHRFSPDEGMVAVTLADLPAKPRLLSVVPSLDTPVCSVQTTTFEERLSALGDAIAAYTISLDLPFAQARFCGANGVSAMQTLSDYQTRSFGTGWGLLIEEMKLLARAVYVLDPQGTITHAQLVPEISHEPDYEPALAALEDALRVHV